MTTPAEAELAALRGRINEIDDQLLALFAARMQAVGEVAVVKATYGMEPYQPARHTELMSRLEAEAEGLGVPVDAFRTVWGAIHSASVEHQHEVMLFQATPVTPAL